MYQITNTEADTQALESKYEAALAELGAFGAVAKVAAAHGLESEELTTRAAVAEAIALGTTHYGLVANAYGVDPFEVACRLLELGEDVPDAPADAAETSVH